MVSVGLRQTATLQDADISGTRSFKIHASKGLGRHFPVSEPVQKLIARSHVRRTLLSATLVCLARRTPVGSRTVSLLALSGHPAEAPICWVGFGLSLTGSSAAPPLSSNSRFKHRTHMARRAIDGGDRIHQNVPMIATTLSGRLGGTVRQGVVLRLRSRNLWMTRAWWQLEDRTAAADGLSAINPATKANRRRPVEARAASPC